MDLNYLLKRQQEERSRAGFAACDASRAAHETLATEFEERIRQLTDGRIDIVPTLRRA